MVSWACTILSTVLIFTYGSTLRARYSSVCERGIGGFKFKSVCERGIGKLRTRDFHGLDRITSSRPQLTTQSISEGAALQLMPASSGGEMQGPIATKIAKFRAALFYSITATIAIPLFAVMLALAPPVLIFDRYRRALEHSVNRFWAAASTKPLYNTKIEGLENLPGPKEPAIYVANHQSYLDIYTLLTMLPRPFKFVSKTSNFLIPIIGWSMFLTGHVGLNRMDRRSQIRLINDCRKLLDNGAQVLLFPEGTRTTTWMQDEFGKAHPVMGSFKKGAFSIAKKAKVPIIPISLVGTGNLMPNGREFLMFPGSTKMVIHPRIETEGRDANELMTEARNAIASALPEGSY